MQLANGRVPTSRPSQPGSRQASMSRRGGRGAQAAPSWAEVDAFLEMASKALRVRAQAAQELEARLTATSLRLEQEIREKGQASAGPASPAAG